MIKPVPKLILFVTTVGILLYGGKKLIEHGYIQRPNLLKTLIPMKADFGQATVLKDSGNVKALPTPTRQIASVAGPSINMEIWAWNAQMGLIYSNGGPNTTVGSSMQRHGINLHLRRLDDTEQMKTDLLTFASALNSGDSNPQSGVHFIAIMGDGAAQFFASINPKLERLGPEYKAEVVGPFGYSRGEDGFWGLPEWKSNPSAAKGALIAGVLRDGDWNIAMDWMARNNVPNNPDDKTYDPEAVNWVNAETYTKAAEMYVQGVCEDPPIKGKPRQTKHVCVNGVVTWTPGDVTLAKGRGGLVPLLTTRENAFQMPNVMIGIHKWNTAHRNIVTKFLAAGLEGGDQVRNVPGALEKAGEMSYAIYKEESPEYWVKYYKGVTEDDKQGNPVRLGGSAVANLADALQLFGLSGGPNILKGVYETFGNIVVQQYPTLYPSYPKFSDVVDSSYLEELRNTAADTTRAEAAPTFTNAPMREIVGKRNYSIQFRTGSAEILPQSFPTLNSISDDIAMTNLAVALHGHTDNTGTPEGNMALSKARADSVRTYLERKGSLAEGRVRTFAHGQEAPIAPNSSEAGRAQNRRVQIVLGTVE